MTCSLRHKTWNLKDTCGDFPDFVSYSLIRKFCHSLCIQALVCSLLSCVRLSATPWTLAHQAPLSIGFSRHKYWSGLPFSSLGDLPDPGVKPRSPALQADSLPSEPPGKPSLSPDLSSMTITSSSISTTFCKENPSKTSKRQKMLFKSLLNCKAQIFTLQEYTHLFSLAKTC